MKSYHVHVYQIASMGGVDVEADNERDAMSKALKKANAGEVELRFPDCGRLAIPFPNSEKFDPRDSHE